MSTHAAADDLSVGYEAMRAQAVGGLPVDSPRGRALVLTQGLPTWIRAWAVPPPTTTSPALSGGRSDTGGRDSEVVRLLTEMALGHGATLAGAS